MMTYLYRTSILKFTIAFLALVSLRKSVSGDAKKIFMIYFIRRVFSEYTKRMLPLENILLEKCAFISCTVWTKMSYWAC